jgi:hypothetical protein
LSRLRAFKGRINPACNRNLNENELNGIAGLFYGYGESYGYDYGYGYDGYGYDFGYGY